MDSGMTSRRLVMILLTDLQKDLVTVGNMDGIAIVDDIILQ